VQAYEVVRSAERLAAIAQEIDDASAVGLDIETTSKSPLDGDIRLVQLNTGKGIYVIDLFETKTLGPVVDALRSDKCVKIIQNAKFEQRWFLHKYQTVLWPVFDTFRASWMLTNGQKLGHNLHDLFQRELRILPEAPDMQMAGWSGVLEKEHYDYAAEDVFHLLDLRAVLKAKVAKEGLNRACLLEFGAILGEAEIENNGFRLDADRWSAIAQKKAERLEELQAELDSLLPHPKGQISLPGISAGFNMRSPPQVMASFKRLGVKMEDTRAETFAMMATKHPAVPKFMEYRKVAKALDAFGEEYLQHIHPETGRIHTDFWPLTGAGRYSSREPNLQQIPRGADYRSCFSPGPGKKIVVCDYSQIELRIVAQITRDPTLMKIYLDNEDAHRKTASIVSHVSLANVTKKQRQAAKAVNFGLIYGLGAERLVIYSMANYGVPISLAEAKTFIKRYFEGYAGVRRWHDRAIRDFERHPVVRTLSGRLRYMEEKAHGEVFNTPVQGTGADGLKSSLPLVYHALSKYSGRARMVHMVHDEIVTEVDDDPELIDAVKKDVAEAMVSGIQPFLPDVPVVVEPDVGDSWAAHG